MSCLIFQISGLRKPNHLEIMLLIFSRAMDSASIIPMCPVFFRHRKSDFSPVEDIFFETSNGIISSFSPAIIIE